MARVAVDANDPGHLDIETRLLPDLAHDRLGDPLTDVHGAAGQRPQVVVGAPLQ
jgi:hypothetical protein